MELDQIGRRSRSDDYLANLRLQGVQRNPWLDLASSAMGIGAGFASQMGQPSLAGIQAGAKASADFGNASSALSNQNMNKILASRGLWGY